MRLDDHRIAGGQSGDGVTSGNRIGERLAGLDATGSTAAGTDSLLRRDG